MNIDPNRMTPNSSSEELSRALGSPIETSRISDEYKKRPDYPLEAEEAERVLATLGTNVCDYGMLDAKSLLEDWHGSVCRSCARPMPVGPMEGR